MCGSLLYTIQIVFRSKVENCYFETIRITRALSASFVRDVNLIKNPIDDSRELSTIQIPKMNQAASVMAIERNPITTFDILLI